MQSACKIRGEKLLH